MPGLSDLSFTRSSASSPNIYFIICEILLRYDAQKLENAIKSLINVFANFPSLDTFEVKLLRYDVWAAFYSHSA
jgi:hypothetical protein